MEGSKHTCPNCELRAQEAKEQDEMHFSVLLALVPLMTLTVFNLMGFI